MPPHLHPHHSAGSLQGALGSGAFLAGEGATQRLCGSGQPSAQSCCQAHLCHRVQPGAPVGGKKSQRPRPTMVTISSTPGPMRSAQLVSHFMLTPCVVLPTGCCSPLLDGCQLGNTLMRQVSSCPWVRYKHAKPVAKAVPASFSLLSAASKG